ncbi:cutinase family protein [Nocardia sp. CA-120079]|uniref:cutinase family protein n=1 Tax=Nocardia sp. CA-120079 TaxID=3239974 RepID=UPI003D983882
MRIGRWTSGAISAAATVAVVAAATITGAGDAAAMPGGCTQYTAVIAPGTWETTAGADMYQQPPTGMLNPVADGLTQRLGANVTVLYVPYAASAFDQGLAYAGSKATLVSKVREILGGLCSSTRVIAAGYSQGADGLGDVMAEIGHGTGPISADRVVAVGLLSDPRRDPKTTQELGAQQPGQGMAGPREGGFGSLTSKVRTLCGQGDLYCSVSSSSAPFISAIGKVLGGNTDPGSPDAQLSSSLVSDFSRADNGVGATAANLADRAKALPSDADLGSIGTATNVAGVGAGASSLVATLGPLQDVQQFVKNNQGAADALRTAPAGSPESAAAQVLNAAGQIDIPGAISTAVSLANSAQQILAGGSGGGQAGTAPLSARDSLAPRADQLATQTAPLAGLDSSTISTGLGILKALKPNTIIKQVLNVGTGVASTAANIPKMIDSFARLIDRIAAGDIPGAHQAAGEVNNAFSPIVKMAAGVDVGFIGQIVSMAGVFDPSGWTSIAGAVISLLGNLDIIRIANDIGQAQEVAWRAVEKLGQGDVLGAGAEMTGLLPVGIDLAGAAAGVLTGGTKTDPSQLGHSSTVGSQSAALAKNVASGDLAGLAGSLSSLAGSDGAGQLADLAREGADVATFYASNAHTNYAQGVQQLLQFLLSQIRS